MMLRPRHYSTMNRCIARSVSYSLRQSNRNYNTGNSRNTSINNSNGNNATMSAEETVNGLMLFFLTLAVAILLTIYCPIFMIIVLLLCCIALPQCCWLWIIWIFGAFCCL